MTTITVKDVLERVEQGRAHEDDIYVLAGVVRWVAGRTYNGTVALDLDNAEWELDEEDSEANDDTVWETKAIRNGHCQNCDEPLEDDGRCQMDDCDFKGMYQPEILAPTKEA